VNTLKLKSVIMPNALVSLAKGQILSRNWRIVRFLGRNSLAKYSVMSCSDSYSVDGKYLLCAGEVSTLEIGQNYSVHLHARY